MSSIYCFSMLVARITYNFRYQCAECESLARLYLIFWFYDLHPAGNRISTQTGIGTVIAIAGVAIYSLIKANMEEQKRVRDHIG